MSSDAAKQNSQSTHQEIIRQTLLHVYRILRPRYTGVPDFILSRDENAARSQNSKDEKETK